MLTREEPAPKAVEQVREERVQSLRAHMARVRARTPMLLAAARDVDAGWFGLDDAAQDVAIAINNSFETDREADLAARFKMGATALLADEEIRVFESELVEYQDALRQLNGAVERALAEEQRRLRLAEDSIASDPEALAEIARGEREFAAGTVSLFTGPEFEKRFNSL